MTPDDPLKRDFAGLERDADGKFDDDDLVAILASRISDVAGASGANNVPGVLRAVEILGMEQARAWRYATLNEFRKFFGLTPHRAFEDINLNLLWYPSSRLYLITPISSNFTRALSAKRRRSRWIPV